MSEFFNPFASGGSGGGGAAGKPGRGIVEIVFLNTTDISGTAGKPGATDTYRINYTDGTHKDFIITNGANGQVGNTPIFQANEDNNYLQVSYDNGTTFNNLIKFELLKGEDGISITNATINNKGELILTLTGEDSINVGVVKGADGTSIKILGSLEDPNDLPGFDNELGDCYLIYGDLWIYTNSEDDDAVKGFKNVGTIQGPQGVGIQSLNIGTNETDKGVLFVTYTNGNKQNIGNIIGPKGETPLLQKTETHIQVSYDKGNIWSNIVALKDIAGEQGISIVDLVDNKDGTFKGKLSNNEFTNNIEIPNAHPNVLTWEEYQNLTEAEKNNGLFYYIIED